MIIGNEMDHLPLSRAIPKRVRSTLAIFATLATPDILVALATLTNAFTPSLTRLRQSSYHY
jgi:hypothetical protein